MTFQRRTQNEERRTDGLPAAFTLIELLVVMVVAAIIMAAALPSFISIGRGMGMRTAVNSIRSTVALSRQWAITHREQITFIASPTGMFYSNGFHEAMNDHACYYAIDANGGPVQSITDLPLDVSFEKPSGNVVTNLTFKTDGGLVGVGFLTKKIVLVDKNDDTKKHAISVNGLTGGIKVE